MEVEAFDRARAFDAETIIRQNNMIGEQRREIDRLRRRERELEKELVDCARCQGNGRGPRDA